MRKRSSVLGSAVLIAALLAVLVVPAAAAEPAPQAAAPQLAPLVVADEGRRIPGRYLVALDDGADPALVARRAGVATDRVYTAALSGFSAALHPAQVELLRRTPGVAAVEEDAVVALEATQAMDGSGNPAGLDRIDQRQQPLSRTYTYARTGTGVTAYVIDTGIQSNHPDFGGRARNVYDAVGGNGEDCNGHGTHVAGTVGGARHGVAKGVALRGLRVLGCNGSGSTSGIVAAVDWLRANAARPAVANLSLGGGASSTLDRAITNLSNSGVFVAVAAGNESQNSCNVSPARAAAAYTTAASDRTDLRASFSNFGSCVDGYAPGVAITSAWIGSSTRTISGTSMASPHVAGVGALYKQAVGDVSSATVSNWINGSATTGVVRSNVSGTPNRLLFTNGL